MSDIEAPTRALLRAALADDFVVHEGWEGLHKHGSERVKYDLVLEPRPHLIEKNFDAGYVIVEVKLFNHNDKTKHDLKARDLLWQCVAYSFSDIAVPSGISQRPLFVLYYIGGGKGIDSFYEQEVNSLHAFVHRGGVGRLTVEPKHGWSMRFGGSFYFRSRYGKGPHHVGTKRQTGSAR